MFITELVLFLLLLFGPPALPKGPMKSALSVLGLSVTPLSHDQQGQYGKVRDLNFGAVVLTFDYENVSNLMIFGTGRPSQKFGQFFMGHLGSEDFAGQRALRAKNQHYQIWSYYMSLECKLYNDLKMQKKLCPKTNI